MLKGFSVRRRHEEEAQIDPVLNNIDPQRDIEFSMGPIDSLDHASRLPNYGSKMGVDATRKWPEEGFTRPWPKVLRMPGAVQARVDGLWKKAGL